MRRQPFATGGRTWARSHTGCSSRCDPSLGSCSAQSQRRLFAKSAGPLTLPSWWAGEQSKSLKKKDRRQARTSSAAFRSCGISSGRTSISGTSPARGCDMRPTCFRGRVSASPSNSRRLDRFEAIRLHLPDLSHASVARQAASLAQRHRTERRRHPDTRIRRSAE